MRLNGLISFLFNLNRDSAVSQGSEITTDTSLSPLIKRKSTKLDAWHFSFDFGSDSAGIQTRNLLIRSQVLYSVELRSLFLRKRVQRYTLLSYPPNISGIFFRFYPFRRYN